ncbi:PP2C family protein-serine/threonine phosphatase [Solibacillus sp. A46]|uniref:PP2C family protein-serine/threonine phosphatase n=1 Tax=Solibacillus faecavium TaxID=2762221 RepID=A0ABR8Y260_9BACL|nr:PP2C family protein-serine/threonine phosphatase [Solibacillus faecavium]MBD8038278.1 PP2C family protein-serine/threonine phosphatase [Solibacillus faecavium]
MKELQMQYQKILSDFLSNQTERNLYIGQNFIRQLIQKKVAPEEVINIHKHAMEQLYPDLPEYISHSYDFLIEIMVHFGLTLKEHQSLLEQQEELRMEMNVATKIQNMILSTEIPQFKDIDIGMVSIPIRKMNGDYVHFLGDKSNVSVAVTDVVGKGVPAALCMSMVKYGLDTLECSNNAPSHILGVLNRIIEKSVDDSMFVSMFYGTYNVENGKFTYGSAGHEPSLYYNSSKRTFFDLESKGLLLGVMPEVKYPQYEVQLEEGDFIVMMTDGVTDFRKQGELDPRDVIKNIALSYRHFTAQEMCEKMYAYLKSLPEFDLEDDFTVVIFKK